MSTTKPAGKSCTKCGTKLPADVPQGICPRCELHGVLDLLPAGADPADRSAPAILGPTQFSPRGFGNYELLEEIARGGMGVVFRARQVNLDRIVAVKMILSGPFAAKEFVQRFRAEAGAAAVLQHPNIVAIHDVGVEDGQHYFSMDYVEGQNLAQFVGQRPLPTAKAARYVKRLAEAIHYAHEQGVLHRDLKPSNVLIDAQDQPRITDFGLAKRLDGESSLTMTGQLLGSPNFMPPEQAGAGQGKAGKPSDVYGLGGILYFLLTARAPFQAESLEALVTQVVNTEPISPRLLNPSVPRDLETICLKCLEKDSHKRYPTAQLLADELDRFQRDQPIHARPVGLVGRSWRWCRRKPVVAAFGAATLALLLILAVGTPIAALRINRARHQANQSLYAADMKLAAQAWEGGEIGHARALLERHRPKPGQPDLRDFEWRLFWGLCLPENLVTLPVETSIWDSLALSPNGQLVATGGQRGRLLLWDVAKHEAVGSLLGHELFIGCLAFSPDGRTLASGSGGLFAPNRAGELKLWDVPSGALLTNLLGHTLSVNDLAFSHDGRFLATAGADKSVLLWDVTTRKVIGRLESHTDEVLKLAFSPTQLLLATASRDRTAKLWEIPSGRCIKTLAGHTLKLWSVVFSADGTKLATGGLDAVVMVWEVASGQLTAAFPQRSEVFSVTFSPDNKTLACGVFGGVTVWDLQLQEPILNLKGHSGGIGALKFLPDGQTLLGSVEFGRPWLWSIPRAPKVIVQRPHSDGTMALAISHDGKILATGSGDFFQRHRPSEIKLWDLATGHLRHTLTNHQADVIGLAFTPDNQLLASGSVDGSVRLWDVTSGRQLHALTENLGEVWALAVSPDGRTLASGTGDQRIQLWDIASGNALPPLVHTGPVDRVAYAPHSGLLASGSRDGTVRIWDPATRKINQRLQHRSRISALVFSPDGTLLAAGGINKAITLWDVGSGRTRAIFEGHQHVVNILAFSPNGKLLASGSVDATVKLWNLAIGQEVATLRGHRDGIFALTFTPDGHTLISGSRDKTVRFWHAPSFGEIQVSELQEASAR